jgi:hypothetical protein
MVLELSVIHVLRNRQRLLCLVEWDSTYAMYTAG